MELLGCAGLARDGGKEAKKAKSNCKDKEEGRNVPDLPARDPCLSYFMISPAIGEEGIDFEVQHTALLRWFTDSDRPDLWGWGWSGIMDSSSL